MKFRHAAALALVGWYLMIPPTEEPYEHAPLSDWSIHENFDTAAGCDRGKEDLSRQASELTTHFEGVTERYKRGVSYSHAKCIATDDPRLKADH